MILFLVFKYFQKYLFFMNLNLIDCFVYIISNFLYNHLSFLINHLIFVCQICSNRLNSTIILLWNNLFLLILFIFLLLNNHFHFIQNLNQFIFVLCLHHHQKDSLNLNFLILILQFLFLGYRNLFDYCFMVYIDRFEYFNFRIFQLFRIIAHFIITIFSFLMFWITIPITILLRIINSFSI